MAINDRLEKRAATWDQLSHDPKDTEDFKTLMVELEGDNFDQNEDYSLSAGDGFLLRRDGKAIGYIFFDIDTYIDNRTVLEIADLRIKDSERSPGVLLALIKELRKYALSKAATYVEWVPAHSAVERVSKNLSDDDGHVLIPIEDFDVSKLVGRI